MPIAILTDKLTDDRQSWNIKWNTVADVIEDHRKRNSTDESLIYLDHLLGDLPDKQVLAVDIGCGNGRHILRYPKALGGRFIGADFSLSGLHSIRAIDSHVDLSVSDATQLSFRDGVFDLVLMVGVVYEIEDLVAHREVFAEIRRVLKVGGVCLFISNSTYLNESLDYLEAIEALIKLESPSLFLLVYEEGPYGRAATIAGHWHDIPTVALQHGTITSPHTPSYCFTAVSTDVGVDAVACPVSTKTAVFGEFTKRMLTDVSSYPDSSIEVVGMPAFDGVINSLSGLRKSEELTRLGLDLGSPVVLIASQPFFNPENRHFFVDTVLDASTRLPGVQWVIKLHPSEPAEAWDSYLAERKTPRVRVFSSNLHRLLFVSDAMVSWLSTTILEACLFSKPVVAVRIPGAWMPDELCEKLELLIADTDERDRLIRKATEAVSKHCYRRDGRATERVVDLVVKLAGGGDLRRPPEGAS